ncbi:unnamed protein product [Rhizophagus irregularis]|uniref:Ubiquitin-like domain-containing protein n=1 Tax=Rhizophagus irregularis TaxID=588596 RepID=A0A2I1GP96_9GLOM|nr:hypothetical protein RhiirA4_464061 [Rhizophagus irregularis]CAB4444699.1 unnamed protein product [Rhizophagus irregularis]
MSQLPLVASAISSIIKCPVKTYDECKADGLKIDLSQILDLDTIYKKSLIRIEKHNVPKEVTTSDSNKLIQIFIKPLDGDSKSIFVDPSITVLEFKNIICAKFGSDIRMMRLIFNGKQLNDFKTLTSYNIQKDPSYDYDFTNLRDNGTTFIRGMELYKRPYGWKRIALNIRKPEFADSIAREGYLLGRGVRFAYGMGVYSTPEINIAERYASQFDRYYARWRVVFQNRVNPVRLSMYHNNVYWVTQRDDDIRPYGLCIKKICDL